MFQSHVHMHTHLFHITVQGTVYRENPMQILVSDP